jgi:hypothetical protein
MITSRKARMAVHVVRLGSPRAKGEGLDASVRSDARRAASRRMSTAVGHLRRLVSQSCTKRTVAEGSAARRMTSPGRNSSAGSWRR